MSTLNTVATLASDFAALRAASPSDWQSTLVALLARRGAPMLLLDSSELEALGELPRSDAVADTLVPISAVRPGVDLVAFVSHRWWRPGVPDDGAHTKVKTVLAQLAPLRKRLGTGGKIYLWWDFFSINQVDRTTQMAQILAIPCFLVACDALFALRAGDKESYVLQTETVLKGKYGNRVWTMLELFAYTSDLAFDCAATRAQLEAPERLLVDVAMGYDAAAGTLVCEGVEVDDRLQLVREELHDVPKWSLPPGENLTDQSDLDLIEPMLIALTTKEIAESGGGAAPGAKAAPALLRAAARFGFERAAGTFVELIQQGLVAQKQLEMSPIDEPDGAGHPPLMRAVMCHKTGLVRLLLANGADATLAHPKLGTTALHVAVALGQFDVVELLLEEHKRRGAPIADTPEGRTLLHLLAANGQATALDDADATAAATDARGSHVKVLLTAGVDPTARDGSGRTASDLALARGDEKLGALLNECMSEAQRAACHPATVLVNELDPVPLPAVALAEEPGTFVITDSHGEWAYDYVKIEPKEGGGGAGGGDIIVMKDFHDNGRFCRLVAATLGVTVWRFDVYPSQLPGVAHTFSIAFRHLAGFIRQRCNGGAVAAMIGFCRYCEIFGRVAAAHPELVGSLVLLAASADPNGEGGVAFRIGFNKVYDKGGGEALGEMLYGEAMTTAANKSQPKVVDATKEAGDFFATKMACLERCGVPAEKRWSAFNSPHWGHWADVKQPTFVVGGLDDQALFLSGTQHLISVLPNVEHVFYPGAAHLPQLECPRRFDEEVVAFLRRQSTPK